MKISAENNFRTYRAFQWVCVIFNLDTIVSNLNQLRF